MSFICIKFPYMLTRALWYEGITATSPFPPQQRKTFSCIPELVLKRKITKLQA